MPTARRFYLQLRAQDDKISYKLSTKYLDNTIKRVDNR